MSAPFPAGASLAFFINMLDRMETLGAGSDARLNDMMNVLLDETARMLGTMLSHAAMPQEARDEFVRRLDEALTEPDQ
ncbi:MAG: hypothetical protein ACXWVD_00505 [Telluria sp.]